MKFFRAVKTAGKDFFDDECMVSGASLAYYTIFSLPPLLVIVFEIAGWFGVSHSQIDGMVKKQLGIPVTEISQQQTPEQKSGIGSTQQSGETAQESGTSGDKSDSNKQGGKSEVSQLAGMGIVSRIIGIAILVFSATGLFAQLQHALNRAWEVEPDPEQGGVVRFVVKRLLSLGMVIVIAFLLLVSLVLTTLVDEIVGKVLGSTPGGVETAAGIVLNAFVTLLLATILFAAMFKILPDAKTSWRDLVVGAAITSLLFVIGKTGIAWYLQNSQVGSGWGSAAASMVLVLVWVYYSSLIVLFGAELTQVWAREFGSGIEPVPGAVRMVEEKRHIRDNHQQQPA